MLNFHIAHVCTLLKRTVTVATFSFLFLHKAIDTHVQIECCKPGHASFMSRLQLLQSHVFCACG